MDRKLGSIKSSSLKGSLDSSRTKQIISLSYGGLGYKFFDELSAHADKVLQVDTINNVTETRGSVKIRAVQLAVEMKQRVVNPNDIVLIMSKTHANQTVAVLATLFLGAIVAAISPDTPLKDCLEIIKKLRPKMCFCDTRIVSQIERILDTISYGCEIVNFGSEVAGTTQFCKLISFKQEPEFKPIYIENPNKEVAFILSTLGTTGDPKLVCLSHHNIYTQCIKFVEIFENASKIISFFPLSWITQTVILCFSINFGITVIMASNFNERTACKMIHDFLIDVAIFGTELAMRFVGNVAIKDYNIKCLKYVLIGVVNTSKDDIAYMRKSLPDVKFLQLYTLTETGCISAVTPSNYVTEPHKNTSVGKLLMNCKIKIIDIETGQLLGPNQFGELYFSGDGLMLGYFKDNSATMASMDKGYFKTGDLVRYDEEGWIYFGGRIDEMIVINNVRCTSTQLENDILAHPLIHDVVILSDQQEIVACIEKKPDSVLTHENLQNFMINHVPHHEVITRILFFDELPRTIAGNVKKNELRNKILKVKIEYTRSLASIDPSVPDVSETHLSKQKLNQ
ncbi:uncharacterized protein LOC143197994 [Rhynchophorus ferrugineus]|uniref:uncharacterized protein LOC143197994 n=1 Tax=Rhynchophorus ferrugineus TaxID=354439 RepID=UPI003FCDEB85